MNLKAKFIFICVLFGGLGIISLIMGSYVFVTGTGPTGVNLLLDQYSNPLVRYSIPFLFFSLSIPCLVYPALTYKGIITIDYYNSSQHTKAKSNFIIITLLLPAALFLFLLFRYEGGGSGLDSYKAVLALVIFGVYYLNSIYVLLKQKECTQK